jgi:hypothetical protein
MNQMNKQFKASVIIIIIAMLACNTTGDAVEVQITQPPTELVTAVSTNTNSTDTPNPIVHQIYPPADLLASKTSQAGDQDSSVTAGQRKSNGGDRFTFEQFERPFNANSMDIYFPNLDIINTATFEDDIWIYGTIQVKDRSAVNVSPYRFAMQVDVNADGFGDWLILALNPSSTEWTTDGVEVYFDADSDVGNLTAMRSDKDPSGNGFEQLMFDQGKGDDPDAAWVRVSPNDTNTVEIVVKRSLLGKPFVYMVNMWTGHGTLDPSMFDYSDHYTHEQAGASDPEYPFFYPIKGVYELDNSCRIAVGFQPTGNEPGLCFIPKVVPPAEPGSPSCVEYGGSCSSASQCCNGVPCTGGLCRYP